MPCVAPVDEPGEDHPLDDQVRRVPHDVAVLERPRLALVGIADDVFLVARRVAHRFPLHAGRKAGAAQAAQAARLERRDDAVAIARRRRAADDAVCGRQARVRIDRDATLATASEQRRRRALRARRRSADRRPPALTFSKIVSLTTIAGARSHAETGHVPDVDLFRARAKLRDLRALAQSVPPFRWQLMSPQTRTSARAGGSR